jgi:hypothetical protein
MIQKLIVILIAVGISLAFAASEEATAQDKCIVTITITDTLGVERDTFFKDELFCIKVEIYNPTDKEIVFYTADPSHPEHFFRFGWHWMFSSQMYKEPDADLPDKIMEHTIPPTQSIIQKKNISAKGLDSYMITFKSTIQDPKGQFTFPERTHFMIMYISKSPTYRVI